MKRTVITLVYVALAGLLLAFSSMATIMWGKTGSPGEGTCVSCHSTYHLNAGSGSIQISTIPSFNGNSYVPGQTYTVNVVVSQPGDSLFACDVEILDSLGNNAGTLISTNSNAPLYTYNPNGRINVFGSGTHLNSYSFTFNWVAPQAGKINIYATGMQPNSDGTFSGDYVYSDSLIGIGPFVANGIWQEEAGTVCLIYPNPSADHLIINCGLSLTTQMNAEIRSAKGELFYHSEFSSDHLYIDTKNWPKGVYFITVRGSAKIFKTQKILII